MVTKMPIKRVKIGLGMFTVIIHGPELIRLIDFWIELVYESVYLFSSRLTQGSAISVYMSAVLNDCLML